MGFNENVENKKSGNVNPIVVGLLSLLVLFFFPAIEKLTLIIFIALIIRVFFIKYVIRTCKENGLNTILWVVLFFIFGIWATIALHFIAGVKKYRAEKLLLNEKEPLIIPEKNAVFAIVSPATVIVEEDFDTLSSEENLSIDKYTHCPACLKYLIEKNKCLDCGLEFE